MPINKDIRRKFYGPKWDALSRELRAEAGHRCQCEGICGTHHGGRCPAVEGKRVPAVVIGRDLFGQDVYSTPAKPQPIGVAHLNQTPGDDRRENLLVMCAGCHLRYDRYQHARNRLISERRRARKRAEAHGQGTLF